MKRHGSRYSRRRFLGNVAQGAAFSGVASAIHSLAQAQPLVSSLNGVEHIVIFMQENRSFDHYLGTLSGVRGFGDRRPLRLPGARSVFGQASAQSTVYPFRLDDSSTSGQCIGDVNHEWSTGMAATNGGRLDGWISAKGVSAMSYHARSDIPYIYALADAFTLCDAYFCSVNGPTNPNRLYLMSGYVDPRGLGGGPVLTNDQHGFTWTTYPERLQKAGVSWRIYQEAENFDCNALAWFKQFQDADASSPLAINGMARLPREQFANDVKNGKLPAVSWIISPESLSEHADHLPNDGLNYGALHFLNALAENPSVWAKTIFIWNYDENGGFFDHVPPPTPPPGTPDEFFEGEAIGLGPRVPCLVISPWSVGGHVCSEVFDHTSVLRLLEEWTGVREPNISAWRRDVCGDLLSAFDFTSVQLAFPALPDSQGPADQALNSCNMRPAAAPAGETAPPKPEPGSRPLRALPYRLAAAFVGVVDEQQLEITVKNDGSVGAAFVLYHSHSADIAPVHLTVGAGAAQVRRLPVQESLAYDLELRGPNGFLRGFRGQLSGLEPELLATVNAQTSQVVITASNPHDVLLEVTITSRLGVGEQTLHIQPQATASVALDATDGWYDYRFVSSADDGWQRDVAGHIEGQAARTLAT